MFFFFWLKGLHSISMYCRSYFIHFGRKTRGCTLFTFLNIIKCLKNWIYLLLIKV